MGVVRCCKAFLPLLKQQVQLGTHKGARILNIASMAGKVPCMGNLTAYGASKHAVVAFSHGLRVDLLPFSIQVTTVCPTFHGTPMVEDSSAVFDAYWKTLPKEIMEEYGDGMYETSLVCYLWSICDESSFLYAYAFCSVLFGTCRNNDFF